MNKSFLRLFFAYVALIPLLAACSAAKIEARLEANPQCKDVINPKTGALMPCPETEKAFYKSVGLAPVQPLPVVPVTPVKATAPSSAASSKPPLTPTSVTSGQNDCKPQIHKKTGGVMPCPAPD